MLGLVVKLREFHLTALNAVVGKGLLRGCVPVCALFAQTQSLHFELPKPPASCRYATFISARIVPGWV